MTPLANDCFAYGGDRIARPRGPCPAARADRPGRRASRRCRWPTPSGRCLAAPLVSPRDVPAFDNAAVDGFAFAFRHGMREAGARLTLLPGRAAAGHPFPARCRAGAALRVLTGAVMPAGADTVALQEEVELPRTAPSTIPRGLKAGANRRRAGEDVRAGQTVLATGIRLRPQEIGLAAELGLAHDAGVRPLTRGAPLDRRRARSSPARRIVAGGVYDANRPILQALLRSLPVEVTDLGIAPDDAGEVRRILAAAAARHDVAPHLGRRLARRRGPCRPHRRSSDGRLDFWQIAMKPGRPLAFGRLGGAVFVGLPGNPGRDHGLLPAVRPAGPDAPGRLRLAHARRACRCRPHSP